jgi:hypothetical protein
MSPTLGALVAVLCANLSAVTALWLHLRWQARLEATRQRTLLRLVSLGKFNRRCATQFDDERADGSRLRILLSDQEKPGG